MVIHLLVLLRADSLAERRYRRDRRDSARLSTARRTVRQHTLHQTFRRALRPRVSVPKGQGGGDHMAPDHRGARGRLRTLLSTAAARPTAAVRRHGFYILTLSAGYICLLMGGVMDEPAVEERHDGRILSLQQRERIVHAGDAPCRERILGEPTDAVLL